MQRLPALLFLGALCILAKSYAEPTSTTLPLDGLVWGVSNANGSISLRSSLPAYPINLLIKEGKIQDPLYRFGEIETRWVAMDTWTFTTTFQAPAALAMRSNVDLLLDGVDTFATVYLNDQLVASLENFHRKYVLPVKPWLKSGANTMRITLHPAIPIAIERKMNHPYWIPTVTQLGNIDAYNFARKPAYDFGWDWGPGLAASGIYGGVSITGYDTSLLQSAHIRQKRLANGDFALRIEPELLVPAAGDSGVLVVEVPALGIRTTQQLSLPEGGRKVGAVDLLVPAGKVKLWWPVGYGEQPLYDVQIKFVSLKSADGLPSSALTRRLGFRTVELVEKPLKQAAAELFGKAKIGWKNSVQPGGGTRACAGMNNCGQYGWVDGKKWTFISSPMKPDLDHPVSGFNFPGAFPNSSFPGGDNPWWNHKLGVWTGWGQPELAERVEGESFFFKVNGVPIYAKGSNIIPFHTIPVNATPELIARTVDLAIDGNMNMLRVWGGGWYMPDIFYDLADEKGILIWQETMFACASYPRDDNFMSEVKAEVEQQVRRISWHPSVVIWGGNNEIETSLEWYRETLNNPGLFVHDYTELFVNAIGGLMDELVPELPYVDSSPSNGVISKKPYVKRWGGAWDPRYGDVHHYNYYADCQDFKNYPMAKFVSEHGWPSFPTWPTFKAATSQEDWAVGSPGMEFRQRHFNKTMEMTNQYRQHFKIPKTWTGKTVDESYAKWRRYLYINHVQQAMCIDTAFGYWRRLRSEANGMTMGILYWQLNDVWAGASWSGIDYEGRYKPMQYRVKHQFADFVVQAALDRDNGNVDVFVVSDDISPTTATIDVSVYRLAETGRCNTTTAAAAAAAPAAAGGAAPVHTRRLTVLVPALNAARVYNTTSAELIAAAPGCTATTCFLRVSGVAAPTKFKLQQSSGADLFFVQFKELSLQKPSVRLSGFQKDANGTISFDAATNGSAALLAVLETELKGRFNDNMINIAPCASVRVTFSSDPGFDYSARQLEKSLAVATLFENQTDDFGAEDGQPIELKAHKKQVADGKKGEKRPMGERRSALPAPVRSAASDSGPRHP